MITEIGSTLDLKVIEIILVLIFITNAHMDFSVLIG